MKVSYKYGIKTISGKLDDLVHMAWNKGRVAVARIFVMPTMTEHNILFGEIKKNIVSLWNDCSEAFKEDLKVYAVRRIPYYTAEQIPAYTNYAHFIRLLYAFADETESIDLTTVDKEALDIAGCPTSVQGIIDQGLLPPVSEYEDLTNDW
jgi:hypothetical protein